MPAIINGTAIDVAFKSNSAAKLASEGKIRGADKNGKLFYALAASGKSKFGQVVKGEGIKAAAEKILNARLSARYYSKALFLKMAQDLGKTLRTVKKALPSNAKGKKAKEALICYAELTIEGIEKEHADKIIGPAFQKGINAAAKAKRDRIAKKLAEGARKHSGRRAR
jgi:predicted HNH restriction endonuclease